MRKNSDFVMAVEQMVEQAAREGLLFLTAEDDRLDGRTLHLGGKPIVNMASCSYLGLELDERLKSGAIEAIGRYGTQFSSSRAYMSLPLYGELEAALESIFGMPPLIAPTTTLAHAAALPVLVDEHDVVILDQQVHASVQNGINHIRPQGTAIEYLRHNRMDLLESRLEALTPHHRQVWYMADGVYSMYGDLAPMERLFELLDRFPNFWLYVDDAHGMSWCGPNGRGWALSRGSHPRMVVATSLAKGFGVSGGVLLHPDPVLRRRIRMTGSSFMFSGPMQPANLGAALASARLHLTPEFEAMQAALAERLSLCNELAAELDLPMYSLADVPIRFIGAGLPRAVFATAKALQAEGFYANCAIFPAVTMMRAGLRFTITLHQTPSDIERFMRAVARHLPRSLAAEGSSVDQVFRTFKMPKRDSVLEMRVPESAKVQLDVAPHLTLAHERSIRALDAAEWDRLLGDRGAFGAGALAALESVFAERPEPEHRWGFHYYVVRDHDGTPVLGTFFTEALWKDDMLAPEAASRLVEARRTGDPLFLTSRTLAMGSLVTEGNHLYLDRTRDWRGALQLLLRHLEAQKEATGASALVLRDLPGGDAELDAYLQNQGFVRVPMPDSHGLDLVGRYEGGTLSGLSKNARKHQKKKVLPFDDYYAVERLGPDTRRLTAGELNHCHALYLAVAARNLNLNLFPFPADMFEALAAAPGMELLLLTLKPEHGGEPGALPSAFVLAYAGEHHYMPLICGLDYRHVESHGAYRQMLRQSIVRAKALNKRRMGFGFGADFEKSRFGCTGTPAHAYTQHTNDYQLELLREFMSLGARQGGA